MKFVDMVDIPGQPRWKFTPFIPTVNAFYVNDLHLAVDSKHWNSKPGFTALFSMKAPMVVCGA